MSGNFDDLDIPNPTVIPASVIARVKTAQFGDGYSLRAKDGINHLKRQFNLSWNIFTTAQYNELKAFIEPRLGWDNFSWTSPLDGNVYIVICKNFDFSAQKNYFVPTLLFETVQDFPSV